jgi:hypothetical protein
MYQYSEQDIQRALQQGLVNERDAQHLTNYLGNQHYAETGVDPNTQQTVPYDRDAALQMLMDPSVPGKEKKKLLQTLQYFDQQMSPEAQAEYGYGKRDGGLAALGMMGAGALVGGGAGYRVGGTLNRVITAPLLGKVSNTAGDVVGIAANELGALGGAVAGGITGNYAGDAIFGTPSAYKEPF